MRLLVKLPTRSRPHKAVPLVEKYIDTSIGDFDFAIAMHEDDATMNCREVAAELERLRIKALEKNINLLPFFHNGKTKVQAYNAMPPPNFATEWDIQVATSDDMMPQEQGWDEAIRVAMKKAFPDTKGVLHFFDGHRPDLMTLPIVGRAWYDQFGYVYHPSYMSLFCDNEMQEVSKLLGQYRYLELCIIEHQHPHWMKEPFDAQMKHTESFYSVDSRTFRLRKARHFELRRTDGGWKVKPPTRVRRA